MNRWCRPIQRLFNRRLVSAKSLSSSSTSPSFPPKSMPSRVLNGFLKFGTYSALLTCAATAGVTYAYTVEEVYYKTLRLTDFTCARFPGRFPSLGPIDVQTIDGKPLPPNNNKSATNIKNPSLPPLEFKIPFIARVATVLGECVFFYIACRLWFIIVSKDCFAARPDKLLPDTDRTDLYTLVLDLKETLVHSDWVAEFSRGEHTFKRPGFHDFLDSVHAYGYEVVLYTEATRIDVLLLSESLHTRKSFDHALTLGSTELGSWKRDLSKLNRDPARILYVSAHALENCLQPENCVEIKPWKKEKMDDSTLTDLLPMLEAVLHDKPDDVRKWIKKDELAQPRMEVPQMDME